MQTKTIWSDLLEWGMNMGMKVDQDSLLVELRETPTGSRGLFLTRNASPSSVLFTLVPGMLLNIRTLKPLYSDLFSSSGACNLSATQLITLHLFLHRPDNSTLCSTDPKFGSYLNSLPLNFYDHPLSWLVSTECDFVLKLLQNLTPNVRTDLQELERKFQSDWMAVRKVLSRHPRYLMGTKWSEADLKSGSCPEKAQLDTYIWAWLNVNTRCVYDRLCHDQSDPDNLSMCPILDLANHHPSSQRATDNDPLPKFRTPPTATLLKGDEVYLKYGEHHNGFLFLHYGFVCNPCAESTVVVDDVLEHHLEQRAMSTQNAIKTLLVKYRYWKDWRLYGCPAAYASFRLLPALRLFCLGDDEVLTNGCQESQLIQLWEKQVMGHLPWEFELDAQTDNEDLASMNAEWDLRMRALLLDVCRTVASRARCGLDKMNELTKEFYPEMPNYQHSTQCLHSLWNEELSVALSIENIVSRGEPLW